MCFVKYIIYIYSCKNNVDMFFIYLFRVLHCFQHCTGHVTTGSWKGRGNQYIQFISILYCKLPTNSKQLPAFPLEAVPGSEPRPQRWEARVLPLCHRGPWGRFHKGSQTYPGLRLSQGLKSEPFVFAKSWT